MTNTNGDLEILSPKNQLRLYGYEYYFNSFIKLYQKNTKWPQQNSRHITWGLQPDLGTLGRPHHEITQFLDRSNTAKIGFLGMYGRGVKIWGRNSKIRSGRGVEGQWLLARKKLKKIFFIGERVLFFKRGNICFRVMHSKITF